MTSKITTTSSYQLTAPPGGLMIWIFIIMELLVFTAGFVSFFYVRSENLQLFQSMIYQDPEGCIDSKCRRDDQQNPGH